MLHPHSDMDLNAILSEMPAATPYGFRGKHPETLDHLNEVSTSEPLPSVARTYKRDMADLARICPGINQDTDIVTWVNHNLSADELKAAPRDFLLHTYFALSGTANSDEKTNALVLMNKNLSNSPLVLQYMELKRIELAEKLRSDPFLKAAEVEWNNQTPDYKERVLQYISRLTLDTLMPGKDIAYPEVVFLRQQYDQIGPNRFGSYNNIHNQVYINGTLNPNLWDFSFASSITIHETLHAFQSMLVNWAENRHLDNFSDIKDEARLYLLSGNSQRSAIRSTKSSIGYKTSLSERGPWAFQLAATAHDIHEELHGTFNRDMFTIDYTNAPSERLPQPQANPSSSALPAACLP